MAQKVTNENFSSLINSPVAVIDFWATWCGPCRRIAPIIEKLAEEYEGRAVIAKCDIEECEDITEQYRIMSVPTLLFFKNGEKVDSMIGAGSEEAIKAKIDALL